MLGRTGGYGVRGKRENAIALEGAANATARLRTHLLDGSAPELQPWGSFDLGGLDQSLRKLEAELQSRSPLRWVTLMPLTASLPRPCRCL